MEIKRIKKHPNRNRMKKNIQSTNIIISESNAFFNKSTVKRAIKIAVVSGSIFGVLYASKYLLNATAKMIYSCKNLRDAWRK